MDGLGSWWFVGTIKHPRVHTQFGLRRTTTRPSDGLEHIWPPSSSTTPYAILHHHNIERNIRTSTRHYKLLRIMESGSASRSCDVSNVLLALEKAARKPGFCDVELSEVYDMEKWSVYQNVYGGDKDPFVVNGSHVVDPTWVDCLTNSTNEIFHIKQMLQALLSVTDKLQERFSHSEERVLAAKRSKGIKSLPDDLLANIFQIAVWEEDCDGAVQANRLAIVSRRFRTVALEKRGLWTTLTSFSSESQLEALIRRAGPNEGFHVFIYYDFDAKELGLKSFIDVCRPILPRWKTLTLTQRYHEVFESRRGGVKDALEELHNLFVNDGLQLSMLEELNVYGETSDRFKGGKSDVHAWAANLRALRCDHSLPSSTPLSSVSMLTVTQVIDGSNGSPLKELLIFLRGVPNLLFFKLEAYSTGAKFDNETLPATECPAITSFEFQIHGFYVLCDQPCVAAFMNALRLPSLEEFSVDVDVSSIGTTESECAEWSQGTGSLMCALLPDHIMSTRMKSMFFKLWRSGSMWGAQEKVSPDARAYHIPLDKILRTPTVSLSSFVQVLFKQEAGNARISESRLRELRFVECKNMTLAHLKRTADSLELLGVWNGIERVVVKECEHLVYDEIVEVIGEKRLQYISY
ncbi:hypothetical protein SCHPADRAFT_931876 [Schizopora paradoxa]|uniref:Uncharacterized protein n=1 Tax=Schizopora paradoxa TaxID=27342 RepID=A0A0H2RA70_9AGAM|nr:hypothetical protein SCHPADRAFT_931876 [Schizopora paradoxa]